MELTTDRMAKNAIKCWNWECRAADCGNWEQARFAREAKAKWLEKLDVQTTFQLWMALSKHTSHTNAARMLDGHYD